MEVEMKIRGLMMDPVTNMPIVILKDTGGDAVLPIWVGIYEANAIALEIEKVTTPRPMTHDLIKNILEALRARVLKVVVNDLRDNTFFAMIHLQLGSAEITVDSRPSDAIALALRVGAPIFVEEDVVRRAQKVEVTREAPVAEEPPKVEDEAKIKEWLESIKPGDFMGEGTDPSGSRE